MNGEECSLILTKTVPNIKLVHLKNKIKDLENLFKKIRYVYLNIFNFVNNL